MRRASAAAGRGEGWSRVVEDHEAGRPRCEQGRGPEKKTQCAVGELRGGERAEQAVLLELEVEAAGLDFDAEAAAGKASSMARWSASSSPISRWFRERRAGRCRRC